jgi:hypothetical protein
LSMTSFISRLIGFDFNWFAFFFLGQLSLIFLCVLSFLIQNFYWLGLIGIWFFDHLGCSVFGYISIRKGFWIKRLSFC